MKKNLCLIGPPGSGKGSYGKIISKALGLPIYTTSDVLRRHGYLSSTGNRNGVEGHKEDNNNNNGNSYGNDSKDQLEPCESLSGKLIDDEIVCQTLLVELQEQSRINNTSWSNSTTITSAASTNRGYLLDGFPRTIRQIKIMQQTWPLQYQIQGAIKLAVPDVVCQQKLEGRRLCTKCGGNYNVADVKWDGWNLPPYLPTAVTRSTDLSSGSSSIPSPPCCDPDNDWLTRTDDTHDVVQHRLRVYHEHMDPILDYFENNGGLDFQLDNNSSRLLKLTPYNGFDDVPTIIGTVQDWIQSSR